MVEAISGRFGVNPLLPALSDPCCSMYSADKPALLASNSDVRKFGGAKYAATGRGYKLQATPFMDLFQQYGRSHMWSGAHILVAGCGGAVCGAALQRAGAVVLRPGGDGAAAGAVLVQPVHF